MRFDVVLLACLLLHFITLSTTLSSPVKRDIGTQIAKPFKDTASNISKGTSKLIGNIKGSIQNTKAAIHERTKPSQATAMKHSEKWNLRIDRNVKKADEHFYKGDIRLATARSYIDQGGTTKKTMKEQIQNRKQFTNHYAQSQVSYANAIGTGSTAIAAKKLRDTTYHIPGLRGHR